MAFREIKPYPVLVASATFRAGRVRSKQRQNVETHFFLTMLANIAIFHRMFVALWPAMWFSVLGTIIMVMT